MNYPTGEPDELWICMTNKDWQKVELKGKWFPDAFIGVMSNLQRFNSGEDVELLTRVDDACQTMCLVEACFSANETASASISYSKQ